MLLSCLFSSFFDLKSVIFLSSSGWGRCVLQRSGHLSLRCVWQSVIVRQRSPPPAQRDKGLHDPPRFLVCTPIILLISALFFSFSVYFFFYPFTELLYIYFLSRFFKRCQNKIQTNQPEKILFFTLAFLQRRKKMHGKNILPLMLTLSLEAEHGYASVLPFDSDYSRKKTKAGTMARKSQNNR